MIRSLQIKNIQSHEDTELKFADGINVIIGSSNQGKSAILRALYWVRTNRLLGIDTLASHWAVNDKGNLFKPMSVKIVNNKGSIERRRTKDDNQYIVNGEVLNVVKTDVPEQVSSILNLSDTNVQKQLDSPFLLSQTSGEAARYFNQIVNLDVIDRILTNAETKRRKLKSVIESAEDDIERLEKEIEEFSWIDDAEKFMNSFNELDSKRKIVSNLCDVFNDEICEFNSNSERKDWFDKFVSDRKPFVNKIKSAEDNLRKLFDKIDKLSYSIESYNSVEIHDLFKEKLLVNSIENISGDLYDIDFKISSLNSSIKVFNDTDVKDFSSQKRWIEKIGIIRNEINSIDLYSIKNEIDMYSDNKERIKYSESEKKRLRAMLPKVCPLCGKPLEEDECSSCLVQIGI